MWRQRFRIVTLTMVVLVLLATYGSARATDKMPIMTKMPITTASEEARQAYLQGRDLLERLQGQESLPYFEKAIEKDPKFAVAYLLASYNQPSGIALFEMLDQAVEHAELVSEGERYWILGFKEGVHGNPLKQREYYKKLVKTYPEDERARNILALHYYGQQEFEDAVDELEETIKIAPEFSPTYNVLGYSHRALKNYSEAERAFKKYIELIPNDPNPYDSYGELLLKMGQFDRSIKTYEKALEHNPNFIYSYLGIATNLYLSGEYDKARAKLEEMFRIARDDRERRMALSANVVIHVDEGNVSAALDDLDVSYRMAEKNDDVPGMTGDLATMAELLYESGRYQEALAKWKKSLAMTEESNLNLQIKNNTKRMQLYNTGRVALRQGNRELARKNAEEFLRQAKLRDNTSQIWLSHDLLGMIAMQERQYDQAVSHLLRASRQNPYVLFRLGVAYEGQGKTEKAHEVFGEVANFNIPMDLNFALARSKAKGRLETARR